MQNNRTEQLLAGFLDCPCEYAILVLDPAQTVLRCNRGALTMFARRHEDLVGHPCPFPVSRHATVSGNLLLGRAMTPDGSGSYDTVLEDGNGRRFPAHVSVIACPQEPNNDASGVTSGAPAENLMLIVKDTSIETTQDRLRNIIIEVAHLSNQPKDMVPMLEDIMHVLQTYLEVPLACICLSDDGEAFRTVAGAGMLPCGLQECCRAGGGDKEERASGCVEACTELVVSHEPLFDHRLSDCLAAPEDIHEPMVLLHIPLLSDVAILGVLHVSIPERLLPTYIEDSQVLSLIANKLTSSIRNKQLEKQLHDYAEDLERIVQMRTDQLREKDAQLVQSGKLATLGEMATGIAHEINQPLGGISLMTQGIQRALEKGKLTDAILADRLHSIGEQIERINKIINHLRVFGRQAPEAKSPISINKPILDVLELIGMQLRNHNIEVTLELDASLPDVLGDANRLEQVFLNIIGNARDALEEQEAKVIARRGSPEPPEWMASWRKKILVRSYLENGMVTAIVTDTAGGIPDKVLHKIFEPFFTTKQVGKGTGLGLSISYGIVKEFNGDIQVKTAIDVGSTFIIRIPPLISDEHADPPADEHQERNPQP